VKVSGSYHLPYGVNLGANLNSRQGYPFPQAIRTPNRANSGGTADVNLDPLGDTRLPAFTQVDVRVDKTFTFGRVQLRPTFDVFNAMKREYGTCPQTTPGIDGRERPQWNRGAARCALRCAGPVVEGRSMEPATAA
jgi:hypothetical protein